MCFLLCDTVRSMHTRWLHLVIESIAGIVEWQPQMYMYSVVSCI